ncbi:MFS transporter, DHA1 family, arabinose polymer transporter [Nakamurella panacisegetis]|uniref:MFS transporter, DHA1 family, arabinose polymer transporter n=1 Tax=Nakamurella panacisegetis TaxID=1090615 RepID=A0A1H0QPN5_9ACTN|nr:MFS transporter [Nakamurella panacisegetis]SDP19304.1 MFS transporter, DHA1 family, arabinose polymer transporter [Nakamurella panacisegetis]
MPFSTPAPAGRTADDDCRALTPGGTSLALFSLALGGAALGTAEFASMGVLPGVAASLRVPESTAGLLISAYALGVVIGAPVISVLGARMRRRSLLLVMTALVVLSNSGSALAPDFPALAATRFVAGLPHGAYLGVAALAAASLVPDERRGRAIASVFLGLTVANVAGVPLSTAIGQYWGWRATFALVAVVALASVLAVRLFVPVLPRGRNGRLTREMRALGNGQFWMAVATCVVGFGGIFAVYTYISSTLTDVSGISNGWVPAVLSLFGVGMTVGTVVGGRLADRSVLGTITAGLIAFAGLMAAFTVLVHHPVTAVVGVFLLGVLCMGAMPSMQARLLDVAPDAPTLAASIMHSATNTANAIGAWAGGLVLSVGAGYAAIGWVGAGMAVGGVALAVTSGALDRRSPAGGPLGRELNDVQV